MEVMEFDGTLSGVPRIPPTTHTHTHLNGAGERWEEPPFLRSHWQQL